MPNEKDFLPYFSVLSYFYVKIDFEDGF